MQRCFPTKAGPVPRSRVFSAPEGKVAEIEGEPEQQKAAEEIEQQEEIAEVEEEKVEQQEENREEEQKQGRSASQF